MLLLVNTTILLTTSSSSMDSTWLGSMRRRLGCRNLNAGGVEPRDVDIVGDAQTAGTVSAGPNCSTTGRSRLRDASMEAEAEEEEVLVVSLGTVPSADSIDAVVLVVLVLVLVLVVLIASSGISVVALSTVVSCLLKSYTRTVSDSSLVVSCDCSEGFDSVSRLVALPSLPSST